MECMITVGLIRDGASYLTQHLQKNDYWAEGEKEISGEWIGEAALAMGLKGTITEKPFEALRQNKHPQTGEPLTPRDKANRVAFFDIQLSAPKDVSVLAMVGGDERVREAFVESVKITLREMERFAAVRERRGSHSTSENFRLTGNYVGGMFVHDTSRDLDPQLHAHAVLANVTWDPDRNAWMALQSVEMMRASGYLRQVLYRELATRMRVLGYEAHEMNSHGFAIRGIEHLRERYSKRAQHVKKLSSDFATQKGRMPTMREVEVLVKESRSFKLTEVSTAEVRQSQRSELSDDEASALDSLVASARTQPLREQRSQGKAEEVLAAALRHVYERRSVAREGEVLHAALELHPDFFKWQELRTALETHPDALRKHGEMTLRPIHHEETSTVRRLQDGRNRFFRIGDPKFLPESLTPGQLRAANSILDNCDFASVLIGDAGTGKTTVLTAIQGAHVADGGHPFVPLAPTTKARDALLQSGFETADTVQRFLVSESVQAQARGRIILVDEAGLLSTQQLEQLTKTASNLNARLLLVGDTKQHYSVHRGDALRNVVEHSSTPVVRLSEVLRQRNETDRHFSRLIAAGDTWEAFAFAERQGLLRETSDDRELFAKAAEHYASNRLKGIETLVVIPFWDEIERFNQEARPVLRRVGLLGSEEVVRDSVRPLTWTDEQKIHWDQYRVGDRLLFVKDTRFFKRGVAAEVVEILPDGLKVRGPRKRCAKIKRRQSTTFDVGRVQRLGVSAGDRILIRGRNDDAGFSNGDFREVERVDAKEGRVFLKGGGELPPGFAAWTYGHALTSYRSQGSTSEESLLVLGQVGSRSIALRQFYVANTRYRGSHAIYLSDKAAVMRRLGGHVDERELATEFVQRNNISESESLYPRPIRALKAHLRVAWLALVQKLRIRKTQTQRIDV